MDLFHSLLIKFVTVTLQTSKREGKSTPYLIYCKTSLYTSLHHVASHHYTSSHLTTQYGITPHYTIHTTIQQHNVRHNPALHITPHHMESHITLHCTGLQYCTSQCITSCTTITQCVTIYIKKKKKNELECCLGRSCLQQPSTFIAEDYRK